jgi:hypothetical protein
MPFLRGRFLELGGQVARKAVATATGSDDETIMEVFTSFLPKVARCFGSTLPIPVVFCEETEDEPLLTVAHTAMLLIAQRGGGIAVSDIVLSDSKTEGTLRRSFIVAAIKDAATAATSKPASPATTRQRSDLGDIDDIDNLDDIENIEDDPDCEPGDLDLDEIERRIRRTRT